MKVRITASSDPFSMAKWWYADHIGEVFEVVPIQGDTEQYHTTHNGRRCGILKRDCELVVDESEVYGNDCINGSCDI